MKAVILGKAGSTRVKNKNYRPFYENLSLTDILMKKLLKVLDKKDIFLSSEKEEVSKVADKWGINFILRDEKYTKLETNTVDVVRNVCKDVPGEDDILYCSCMDPLFNDYEKMFKTWENIKYDYDSLNVVYPLKNYYLDPSRQPIGFGFGYWHKYSQYMPPIYQISWATEILTRDCIKTCGYMVGQNPYWYDAYNPTVDIDTEQDWELAQIIYKYYHEKGYL